MTVAVGFHCTDGVVLAADSEISNAYVKYSGDKAWIFKYPRSGPSFELQVGIVGAGDAAFIQYAAERIDAALDDELSRRKKLINMADVNALIQGVLNDLHHTHLYPVPPTREQPEVQLIIGILLGTGRNRLAKTYLTSVTKVWNYDAVGVGSSLANFIIKRFFGGRVTVHQATFIATQVLMHVKANVPACGGDSKVIAMFQNGTVGWVQDKTIAEHEDFLRQFDKAIEPVFFGGSNPGVDNQGFVNRVDVLARTLKAFRKVEIIEGLAKQVNHDMTIPSGSMVFGGSISTAPTVVIQPTKSTAKKSGRRGSTRGRKDQPPSPG